MRDWIFKILFPDKAREIYELREGCHELSRRDTIYTTFTALLANFRCICHEAVKFKQGCCPTCRAKRIQALIRKDKDESTNDRG